LNNYLEALCYPDEKKEMVLDDLVSHAKRAAQRKWKGEGKVVDVLWSEGCKGWVVVVARGRLRGPVAPQEF
jgi:hypothetical protein